MSSNSPVNADNQEIDLSQISQKVNGVYEGLLHKIFTFILFVKRNIIVLIILFVIGAAAGFYLDKKFKSYDHQIIVAPNFESTDYAYAKIDLLQSKINEGDSTFLKEIGIKHPKKLQKIEIKPIIDVYKFIENNKDNFELIKLMAEDGNIEKIIENKITSKNYLYHAITFKTSKLTSKEETVQPILNFLNSSDYFQQMQKEYLNNVRIKMTANDSTISQIDGLFNQFKSRMNTNHSDKLIYFNENTQLNDVILTKENLLKEQSYYRLTLIKYEQIIKETSTILNDKNTKGTNGKMKLILPFLFILLFLIFKSITSFYKRQSLKINQAID